VLSLNGLLYTAPTEAELLGTTKSKEVHAIDENLANVVTPEELEKKSKLGIPANNLRPRTEVRPQDEAKFFATRRGLQIKKSGVCSGLGVYPVTPIKKGTILGFVQGHFFVREPPDLQFRLGVVEITQSPERCYVAAAQGRVRDPEEGVAGKIFMGVHPGCWAGYMNDPFGPLDTRHLRQQHLANVIFMEQQDCFPLEDHRYVAVTNHSSSPLKHSRAHTSPLTHHPCLGRCYCGYQAP
jgi:hypothetical protein